MQTAFLTPQYCYINDLNRWSWITVSNFGHPVGLYHQDSKDMLQDWSLKLVQTPMVSEFHTWLQLPCQEKTYQGAMERAGSESGFQKIQMIVLMFSLTFGISKKIKKRLMCFNLMQLNRFFGR